MHTHATIGVALESNLFGWNGWAPRETIAVARSFLFMILVGYLEHGTSTTKATARGSTLVFTNRFEPLTRVTVYLTDETTLRDMLGASWPTIALRIHVAKVNSTKS